MHISYEIIKDGQFGKWSIYIIIFIHTYTCIFHTIFTLQLDDEMGEVGLNSQVRPTFQKFSQIICFCECLNEIGDGELTTSSGSEIQMPTHRQANMLDKLSFLTMGIAEQV